MNRVKHIVCFSRDVPFSIGIHQLLTSLPNVQVQIVSSERMLLEILDSADLVLLDMESNLRYLSIRRLHREKCVLEVYSTRNLQDPVEKRIPKNTNRKVFLQQILRWLEIRTSVQNVPNWEFFDHLTRVEITVLKGLYKGESNQEIGKNLGLSPKTIQHYRQSIKQKMGARNSAHLLYLIQTIR